MARERTRASFAALGEEGQAQAMVDWRHIALKKARHLSLKVTKSEHSQGLQEPEMAYP